MVSLCCSWTYLATSTMVYMFWTSLHSTISLTYSRPLVLIEGSGVIGCSGSGTGEDSGSRVVVLCTILGFKNACIPSVDVPSSIRETSFTAAITGVILEEVPG